MSEERLPRHTLWVWILCLSALAVGTKNFEQGGIGVDGPHYALVAREMARSGDWFFMRGTHPAFQPSADYPHLGIWLLAAVFRWLPAADWSARLVGIAFYVGFLGIFYQLLRRVGGTRLAVVGVLALWVTYRFSNFFSNVYLDPGLAFFGTASLLLLHQGRALGAGACLALSVMVKGMAAAGFVPALVFSLFFGSAPRDWKRGLRQGALFTLAFALVLGAYLWLVESQVPGLVAKYWTRQWTNRFARTSDWSLLFGWRYWGGLLRDCHGFWLVGLIAFAWKRPRGVEWVPWILIASFSALYAPLDRVGNQYWVVILPWTAWVFAWALVSPRGQWGVLPWVRGSTVLALTLLVVAHLAPVRIHGPDAPEVTHLQRRLATGPAQRLVLDMAPQPTDFTRMDFYVWYADAPVTDLGGDTAVPPATVEALYLLHSYTEARAAELKRAGWCKDERFGERSFWRACRS